jgi:hypothetical protein
MCTKVVATSIAHWPTFAEGALKNAMHEHALMPKTPAPYLKPMYHSLYLLSEK